ncbi:MAG: hypothetical protein COB50_02110 [Thiotrichales bacterium]|nr:MAG: hypothetical protein COB50_02110 [Thiotrichales bacterium]
MLPITTYTCQEKIAARIDASNKKAAFVCLSKLLAQGHENSSKLARKIFIKMYAREKIGSTNLNNSVATPRAVLTEITSPTIAVITLGTPIAFSDDDNKNMVDIVVGLLIPRSMVTSIGNELLEQEFQIFKNERFCQQLRDCNDNKSLYNALLLSEIDT